MNSIILCFFLTGVCSFEMHEAHADVSYSIIDMDTSLSHDKEQMLTVSNGVKNITDGMFDQIAHTDRVTKIVIPMGVETIGKRAFKRFSNLKHITFPSTVKFNPENGYNLRIFSDFIDNGLSVTINRKQMNGFLKHACGNIQNKEISWNIIDSEQNKSLKQKFTPKMGNWVEHNHGKSNWKNMQNEKIKTQESVVQHSVKEVKPATDGAVTSNINLFEAKIDQNKKISIQKNTKVPIKDGDLSHSKKNVDIGIEGGLVKSRRSIFESMKH